MLSFQALVFVYLVVQFSREFGLPPKIGQALQAVLLLLLLFVLIGVL